MQDVSLLMNASSVVPVPTKSKTLDFFDLSKNREKFILFLFDKY